MWAYRCETALLWEEASGRFGFSDILTCMLALDTQVELFHEGMVSLEEFARRPVRRDERDILVRIIIKKDGRRAGVCQPEKFPDGFPGDCLLRGFAGTALVCVHWGQARKGAAGAC